MSSSKRSKVKCHRPPSHTFDTTCKAKRKGRGRITCDDGRVDGLTVRPTDLPLFPIKAGVNPDASHKRSRSSWPSLALFQLSLPQTAHWWVAYLLKPDTRGYRICAFFVSRRKYIYVSYCTRVTNATEWHASSLVLALVQST